MHVSVVGWSRLCALSEALFCLGYILRGISYRSIPTAILPMPCDPTLPSSLLVVCTGLQRDSSLRASSLQPPGHVTTLSFHNAVIDWSSPDAMRPCDRSRSFVSPLICPRSLISNVARRGDRSRQLRNPEKLLPFPRNDGRTSRQGPSLTGTG